MVITNGLYNGLYDDINVCMVITNGLYSYMQICEVNRVLGITRPPWARLTLVLG